MLTLILDYEFAMTIFVSDTERLVIKRKLDANVILALILDYEFWWW